MISIKNELARNYVNFRGWTTGRHIIVIESDDWGSVAMASRQAYDKLLKNGIEVDKNYFDRYDCLETSKDLEDLFEVLSSVKDANGKHAVITPMTIVANPDFEKIEQNDRKMYAYENFVDSYRRYQSDNSTFAVIKEGIEAGVFFPQFHGREHLNVKRWMEAINSKSVKEEECFGCRSLVKSLKTGEPSPVYDYNQALNYDSDEEVVAQKIILKEGLDLFYKIFGYRSVSFCPPCGIMSNELNQTLLENGVRFLQCGGQFVPTGGCSTKRINRFWGDRNENGQMYWRRNCTFEPSRDFDNGCIEVCLTDIKRAFRWDKPAVINSHRVNYIGSIFEENRKRNLDMMRQLLQEIVKLWPDVEFMNSEELSKVIEGR